MTTTISNRTFRPDILESQNQERDWTFSDAVDAGIISPRNAVPTSFDRRTRWWKIYDQNELGACVGYAIALGVLWYYFASSGVLKTSSRYRPSARYIWMAAKEFDKQTRQPTTMLEQAGTQTKAALDIARRFGCVQERDLPISGRLSKLSIPQFYAKAARLKILSYFNLGTNPDHWRRWIALKGPIVARLVPDDGFYTTSGRLNSYFYPGVSEFGHLVCIVGYTSEGFIIRNSYGRRWGKRGFAEASDGYVTGAFTEAYGITV